MQNYINYIFIFVRRRVKDDEIGGADSTVRRREKCTHNFSWNTRRDDISWHGWEDNIEMNIKEIQYYGTNWIRPIQNGDQWLVLVNVVMKLRIP